MLLVAVELGPVYFPSKDTFLFVADNHARIQRVMGTRGEILATKINK